MLNSILESVEKIKISIVMQCNLEDYNSSRSDSISKFHRAVESFKNQLYKNCELIIVADGCNKTYQHYMRTYKQDSNIKFAYFDRTGSSKMYDIIKDENGTELTYYRGFARGIGVAMSTGHIVTYMDSDDYLSPEFAMTIMLQYNIEPDKDWWLNTAWYDHENVVNSTLNKGITVDPNEIESISLDYLPGHKFKESKTIDGKLIMTPWLFTHKNYGDVKWRDVMSQVSSEDVDFFNRFNEMHPNGTAYQRAIYVKCHSGNDWDI